MKDLGTVVVYSGLKQELAILRTLKLLLPGFGKSTGPEPRTLCRRPTVSEMKHKTLTLAIAGAMELAAGIDELSVYECRSEA